MTDLTLPRRRGLQAGRRRREKREVKTNFAESGKQFLYLAAGAAPAGSECQHSLIVKLSLDIRQLAALPGSRPNLQSTSDSLNSVSVMPRGSGELLVDGVRNLHEMKPYITRPCQTRFQFVAAPPADQLEILTNALARD